MKKENVVFRARSNAGAAKIIWMMFFAIVLITQSTIAQSNDLVIGSAASFSTFTPPQNIGPVVNAASIDELPVISPNGLSLFFASDRTGGFGARDIYVSQRPTLSSAWGAPQNLGATVNSTSGDSPTGISPDGRELYLNSQRAGGTGGVDIWVSTRTDTNNDLGWAAPVNMGPVINSNLSDQNANYYIDPATGRGVLLFTSDRSSPTAGAKDVFQSTRNPDGSFNPPVIVPELNSPADDARTAISRDGLEIYLSSNRLAPTTTVQSLFVATRASTASQWNAPVPVTNFNSGGSAPQPSLSADGTVIYFVSDRPGGSGTGDIYTATRVSVNRSSPADFDGDGRSDVSVYRPSDGDWYIMESGTNTVRTQHFGATGDRLVPGDYDGDGRLDLAVFRPSSGDWWISRSSNSLVSVTHWGITTDKPVPGDYDGDGKTDISVYRNGVWYILQSSNGNVNYQYFGVAGDIPVAASSSN